MACVLRAGPALAALASPSAGGGGMNPGIAFATLAYLCWGLFPLYFRELADVPALEVVLHRIVWSLAFVLALLAWRGRWAWLGAALRHPRTLAACAVSALLLSGNWLTYVWAVQHGRVVDASLGYFVLPLVNVALGFVFLGERPRRGQWLAVGVASAGVVWLTVQAGHLPWIALVLALSFGVYGLLRKTAALGALEGLAMEALLLAPVAATVLLVWHWQGRGAMAQPVGALPALLVLAGPFTAIPLLWFAAGARRISMATLGILQYLSPTLQFLLGVWLFHEPVSAGRWAGFALIWLALVLYSVEGWLRRASRSTSTAGA